MLVFAAPAGATPAATVAATNYQFSPTPVTIGPGEIVHWTFSGATHTVTANDSSFNSGDRVALTTYDQMFTTPGVYAYHCIYHGPGGMTGTVVVQYASIAGRVINDLNGDNAVNPGEPGYPGVPVKLYLQSDLVNTVGTTTTDGNGNYSFGNLDAGSYEVTYDQPVSTQSEGTKPIDLTLAGGQQATSTNFKLVQTNGTIAGKVWHDLNGSGTADPGDSGLGGVHVTFTKQGDATPTADV
ncbi:MAG: hypothetical protein QOH13_1647, partial [Thermoleophilaceae bacterium]|nr:hypothetical protein [Thermoleophilaceae bacterium]